jgi:hypothetical protein
MNSVINFVEFENHVVSATYRNLMVKAKVVLVDAVKPGVYFLKALNAHGSYLTRSADFRIG